MNTLHAVIAVVVLLAIGGWTMAIHNKGVAEAFEAEARVERERADSIQRERIIKERQDSVNQQALVDSTIARLKRKDQALAEERHARELAEQASARAVIAAETLEETLSPAQIPLFDSYKNERDIQEIQLRVVIGSLVMRNADLERANVQLWQARLSMEELYNQAVEENEKLRAADAARASANAVLKRSSMFDFGISDPALVGIGLLGGFLLAR